MMEFTDREIAILRMILYFATSERYTFEEKNIDDEVFSLYEKLNKERGERNISFT